MLYGIGVVYISVVLVYSIYIIMGVDDSWLSIPFAAILPNNVLKFELWKRE
jgi:hypothetical protein